MRALFLTILAALSVSQASAADISWKTEFMAPGSLMVMEDEAGGVISHVARGLEDDLYRFDTYEGQSDRAVFVGAYFTNDRGEVIRSLSADGEMTRFEPYRCARTLGMCSYVIVHSDGFRENRRRLTQETRMGIAWKEWGLDGLVASGAQELDKIGATKTGWSLDHISGTRTHSRRILMAVR